MQEIFFEVLEDPTGGYTASALGYGIHTHGETVDDLTTHTTKQWSVISTGRPNGRR